MNKNTATVTVTIGCSRRHDDDDGVEAVSLSGASSGTGALSGTGAGALSSTGVAIFGIGSLGLALLSGGAILRLRSRRHRFTG